MTSISDLNRMFSEIRELEISSNDNKFDEFNEGKILLYGAGRMGQIIFQNLKEHKIEVCCFIDRNEKLNQDNYEIPIYNLSSLELEKYKEDIVILSGLFSLNQCKEIKNNLFNLGFKKIFALHEVNFNKLTKNLVYEKVSNGSFKKINIIDEEVTKVIEAFDLLQEDKDREIFLKFIKAHLTMDFTELREPYDIKLQYFAHDIPVKLNFLSFIDCGGYDGDTILSILEKGYKIDNLLVFEPVNELCGNIIQLIKEKNTEFKKATVYPCGVYSKIEKLKFHTEKDALSSSKVDNLGEDFIQCVAIDDVVLGFEPTFIKMDIEGAELEALFGAKETIKKYRPQLAICVYHSLSHIWEIPLFINKYCSNYVYYLRSYNYMTFETVLYAFPKETME